MWNSCVVTGPPAIPILLITTPYFHSGNILLGTQTVGQFLTGFPSECLSIFPYL